jgi:superfamily I DNA/RNA helicase
MLTKQRNALAKALADMQLFDTSSLLASQTRLEQLYFNDYFEHINLYKSLTALFYASEREFREKLKRATTSDIPYLTDFMRALCQFECSIVKAEDRLILKDCEVCHAAFTTYLEERFAVLKENTRTGKELQHTRDGLESLCAMVRNLKNYESDLGRSVYQEFYDEVLLQCDRLIRKKIERWDRCGREKREG